ncbi:MAG: DUF4349 domain-containing protein [Caldiserica bacterium]|jgi:hypothetical protein|nr:DUF4349 domain-containing protein [Caldisericota bacterium]
MKWKLIIPILILAMLVGGYFLGQPLLKDKTDLIPSTGTQAKGQNFDFREAESDLTPKSAPPVAETGISSAPSYEYDSRVIKSASVELKVEKGQVKSAQDRVRAIAESKGGYVQSSQFSSGEEYAEAYIVINVPESEFNATLKELENLGEVLTSQISGKDVSQEYHDLELDLSHWETERQTVLALLDKATTIDEIIKIRQFLEPIDREINQIKGRLQYLKAKTDLSSIEVIIRENQKQDKPQPTIWTKIWGVFLDSLTGILAFLAAAIPFLALAFFLGYLIWLAVRSYRKKRTPAPPAP